MFHIRRPATANDHTYRIILIPQFNCRCTWTYYCSLL